MSAMLVVAAFIGLGLRKRANRLATSRPLGEVPGEIRSADVVRVWRCAKGAQ